VTTPTTQTTPTTTTSDATALMAEQDFDRIAFVSALDVPPDAILVARIHDELTAEQAEQLSDQIKANLPGRQVIVLSGGLNLDVLRDAKE
jgi:hypothetical protein